MPVKRADKTPMPQRAARERAKDFAEVNAGYASSHAVFEAERCLRCQEPVCVTGCPVNVPIPEFMHAVAAGNMKEAARLLHTANPLSSICGRVCPQELQCEAQCNLVKRFEAVAIGHLERYVADWERTQPCTIEPRITRTEKIAVIGSGPSGLVCAGELARLGYPVTIYEALPAPGGVLRYGIPEFRLPKHVLDWEIDVLKRRGVEIQCNVRVGKTFTLDDLFGQLGFSAVFVGTGAGLPQYLKIPGESLRGVFSANEYLARINLIRAGQAPEADAAHRFGKRVAVIGAGNTAMDAVRSALRMGAEKVMIVYRRSEKEMGACAEEYHHALAEGVEFHWLHNPVEVLGDEANGVTGLRCQKMRLGEADESGRARPMPIVGSEAVFPVDNVVLAIGTNADPLVPKTTPGLGTNKKGLLVAEEPTGLTTLPHVYAGGDVVTGAATVVLAVRAGKRAAAAIHRDLAGVDESVDAAAE